MAELHYFSFYAPDWLSSPAIAAMLPEQEGAFIRLLASAWGNGDLEPSLPADDRALAQLSRLGARWKKLGALVRAQFQERDGRLFNAKLSEVWKDCQASHLKAVERASKGGKAKAEKERARRALEEGGESASSAAQAVPGQVLGKVPGQYKSKSKGEAEPPSGVLQSPAAESKAGAPAALGLEGRASAGRGEDPYRAADARVNSESARRDADARRLADEYQADLDAEIELFRQSHPVEYEGHRIQAIKVLGLFGRELSAERQASVDAETAERIRKEQGWPSKAAYLANHGRPAPTIAARAAS